MRLPSALDQPPVTRVSPSGTRVVTVAVRSLGVAGEAGTGATLVAASRFDAAALGCNVLEAG